MTCLNVRPGRACLLAGAALFLFTAPALALADRHDPAAKPPAGVTTGTCTGGANAFSVSTNLQTTNARTYKDVTGTTVSFTQGKAGCAEVSFSAEAATVPGELLLTQAVLDGKTLCTPAGNIFASDSPSSDLADHAMNYICPSVAAGDHTATIQFRSRFGGKVALDFRTTIVRYTP
ncbi:MAG TPA: hypothetical protein VGF62_10395 [Rhizomicrobium sp.]|jgi:hypothetical protein